MSIVIEGALLGLSTGEYSDYGFNAFVRVLKEFDTREVVELYLVEYPEQMESYSFEQYQFIAWLLKNGYVEETDEVVEWHLGSYHSVDIDETPEPRLISDYIKRQVEELA